MTHHRREHLLTTTPPDTRTMTNQPTSSQSISDEVDADADEPPDDQARTPRPYASIPDFTRSANLQASRKESVLTQMLSNSSGNNTEDEDLQRPLASRRGFSTTSTWSNPSLTDDNGMTSPGTRATTPSPPPPANLTTLPPVFNTKPFEAKPVVIKDNDAVDPLDKSPPAGEKAVEAALGRKRMCMFACGKKDTPKQEPAKPTPAPAKEEPPKRKCMLTFACPSKQSPSKQSKSPTARKASIGRRPSPAPSVIKITEASRSPSKLRRSSISSHESALKNEKTTGRSRRLSTAGAIDTEPTERFCMSNEQRTEDDDWMKEQTCHRSRLTVDDTLTKEINLRKLGKEAEEEEEIEDEAELDNEGVDDADDDDDDEDNVGNLSAVGDEPDLDDGFDSDDEAGMEDSGESDDDGSDYEWWAPGRSTAATSYDHLDQMHFSRQRNFSGSSIGSVSSTRAISGEKRKPLKKRASIPIKRPEPDLPDSTDFVCGTLDEDRPMEEAYKQEIEKRRAAQHVPCPQDIDPTFPTSDPEMDEEDDDDVFDNNEVEESDMHVEGVFGNFEAHEDANKDIRGRPRKSPAPSPPRRMRSPAPKHAVHRSPPPRKLFSTSPKRLKSPAPAPRLRSPPPTRRPSFAKSPKQHPAFLTVTLAERPPGAHVLASSLPRRANLQQKYRAPSPIPDLENEDTDDRAPRPARGAIDIVKGLEKKKQFRREKLYRKYCWQRANGDGKRKEEKKCVPGKGAEKMREMGLELAGRWKGERKYQYSEKDAQHILSL